MMIINNSLHFFKRSIKKSGAILAAVLLLGIAGNANAITMDATPDCGPLGVNEICFDFDYLRMSENGFLEVSDNFRGPLNGGISTIGFDGYPEWGGASSSDDSRLLYYNDNETLVPNETIWGQQDFLVANNLNSLTSLDFSIGINFAALDVDVIGVELVSMDLALFTGDSSSQTVDLNGLSISGVTNPGLLYVMADQPAITSPLMTSLDFSIAANSRVALDNITLSLIKSAPNNTPIPEPGTIFLMLSGLATLFLVKGKRTKNV